MTFESQTSLTLLYHATKYMSTKNEFTYAASFQFKSKITCSNFTIGPPTGSIRWRDILGSAATTILSRASQKYYLFHCVWPFVVPNQYNLTLSFVSEELGKYSQVCDDFK